MPWQCPSEIAIAELEFLAHYSAVGQTDGLCFPSPSFLLYIFFFSWFFYQKVPESFLMHMCCLRKSDQPPSLYLYVLQDFLTLQVYFVYIWSIFCSFPTEVLF